MAGFINLTGRVFQRLTVIARHPENDRWRKPLWDCLCECGNQSVVNGGSLRDGKTRSCGCLSVEVAKSSAVKRFTKHGESTREKSRKWENLSVEYKAWVSMKSRVRTPNKDTYRQIDICLEWLNSYESFISDMGKAPSEQHQLDRIKNHLGYSPDNCRWVTRSENCRNKTNNVLIEWQGETKCLYEWAETICPQLGIKPDSLQYRIKKGWSVEDAFTTPKLANGYCR